VDLVGTTSANSFIDLVASVAYVEVMGTVNAMVMRIVTKFSTTEEFVHSFSRFCTETSCFIPSAHAKNVGVETGFSIRLADGTPMLRGLCVVLESFTDDENPFKRRGVRLGIRKLTPESKALFYRLRRPSPDSERIELPAEQLDDHTKATVEMAPLFPEPSVFEDELLAGQEDSGGIPEPIDMADSLPSPVAGAPDSVTVPLIRSFPPQDVTAPVAVPGVQLAWLTGRPMPGVAEPVAVVTAPETLGPVDPPILPVETVDPVVDMTVPSRAPVMTLLGVAPISAKRASVPRIAMPALSPTVTVEDRELAPIRTPRASVWEWVLGPVFALIRRARWAYRRRRGVRASLRRLPTRS
jgi:hypothetical protein